MQEMSSFSCFYRIYHNFLHLLFDARNNFNMQKMREMKNAKNARNLAIQEIQFIAINHSARKIREKREI